MLDLGSILPSLLENFARLSPIRGTIVDAYDRGVKFSFGHCKGVLEPGLHFYWNWWQSVYVVQVMPQCVESQKLTLTTQDGKTVCLSVAVQYSIFNAELAYTAVQDLDESLLNMIEGECSRAINLFTAAGLLSEPQKFGSKVALYAKKTAETWGCRIENVTLPNLALVRAYRLIGDQPK